MGCIHYRVYECVVEALYIYIYTYIYIYIYIYIHISSIFGIYSVYGYGEFINTVFVGGLRLTRSNVSNLT